MPEQITNSPLLYINGLGINWLGNNQITISAGQCRDSSNVYDMNLGNYLGVNPNVNSNTLTTVSTLSLGVNGVDHLPLIASAWYAIYVIGDPTGYNPNAVVLSINPINPIMPYGYGVYRRIGWVILNSSSNIVKSYYTGTGGHRIVMWDSVINVLPGTGNTSYTTLPLSIGVPPTSNLAILNWRMVPNAPGDNAKLRVHGSTSTNNLTLFGSVAAVANSGEVIVATDPLQQIDYITTSALDGLTIDVTGYYDNL